MPQSTKRLRAGASLPLSLTFGLAAVTVFFAVSGVVSYWNTQSLRRNAALIAETHGTLTALDDVISLLKDAETGQRGYVITGKDSYLVPYESALPLIESRLQDLERLIGSNPEQRSRLTNLRAQIDIKLRELKKSIDFVEKKDMEAARAHVATDAGKEAMDEIRARIEKMEDGERVLRAQRLAEMDTAYAIAIVSGVVAALMGFGLSGAVGYLVRRSLASQRRQEWLQSGKVGLNAAIAGDLRLEELGDRGLAFLCDYVGAQAAVIYAREGGRFRRVAAHGVAPGGVPDGFDLGEGLLGQAARDNRPLVINDVPDGYFTFGSALGRGQPRHLAVAPVTADRVVNGVLELAFVHPVGPLTTELLAQAAEFVGVAARSASYRASLQNLLEETQRQAEELQAQQEELRVNNEELEEQSRALKESHSKLEQQQAELEQTNASLEEQATTLETQRDEIAKSQEALQRQAAELEQASRYKSAFLANMSHELRTPLNSLLILAKLLADNPQGNLSDEQVRYADTIRTAGNDLLTLINDILDLSKIEAGHMEVRVGPVRVAQLADDLLRIFQPMADQKGLAFATEIAPDAPETIATDRQRLEQVLKNLVSNALKFTERGEVKVSVRPTADGRIALAVRDTGIGISAPQQRMVFEAFRQADDTTNRKYGGTGLGLSISRELARLLGGDITLESEPGRGSTFTVVVPVTLERDRKPRPPQPALEPAAPPAPRPPVPPPRRVEDDRQRIGSADRSILIVEDDETFARIVADLAHEAGFQCLVAATAEEALTLAAQHQPSAIVLDVGLPDNSGLSVLDRVKRDARTRHIPVHVVSGHDYAETALALGAVGYMLKPVKREQLVEALQRLESRLEQQVRRVLVVEDDPVQLDAMRRLLGSPEVEAVGVGSAAECLERLRAATFDCMVLDLSLPDMSGYTLLETLSREDAYSFPPVIVYTGRDLSADEEERLRRFSKSIIIKGAKSPERLLDEVTLFLHRVVAELPAEQQRMIEKARSRDAALEGRRILVAEDDVRNVFALTSILEPRGAAVQIARNGREAVEALDRSLADPAARIDLVLMDVMMPEMDGITAMREIRRRDAWKKLPIIALTAKAMKDDQDQCLSAGANDYMPKPLDVEKLLSLVRVWMPR